MPLKNRDFLPPEMVETLRMSANSNIRNFFAGKLTKTGNLILPQENMKEVAGRSKWSSALVAEHEKSNKSVRMVRIFEKNITPSFSEIVIGETVFADEANEDCHYDVPSG